MQAALQNHCNLNATAAAEIIAQGYNNLSKLTTLMEDEVKDLVNHITCNVASVNIPFCAIEGLLDFRYWVILTESMGVATPPQGYNQAERDFVKEVRRDRHAWKLANPNKSEAPKALRNFKEWRSWWNTFDAYMS